MIGAEACRADRPRQLTREVVVASRQRHRRRHAARNVGGKARPGQDSWRRAGGALGDHLGHEFLRTPLDAFGADDDGRARRERRRERYRDGAHSLRRHNQKQGRRPGCLCKVCGQRDAVIDPHPRQKGAFAVAGEISGDTRVGLPQRDLASGADAGQRQRRTPGAGSDDGDPIKAHCCTFPPCWRALNMPKIKLFQALTAQHFYSSDIVTCLV